MGRRHSKVTTNKSFKIQGAVRGNHSIRREKLSKIKGDPATKGNIKFINKFNFVELMKEVEPIKKALEQRRKEIIRRHQQSRKSQDSQTLQQKSLPFRLNRRIDSEHRYYGKVYIKNKILIIFDIDMNDSDLEEDFT